MYGFICNLLFRLLFEQVYDFVLNGLDMLNCLGLFKLFVLKIDLLLVYVMGLDFLNLVGLVVGLDKNVDYLDVLGVFGFGFIEVGMVMFLVQLGNFKLRMFWLLEYQVIINCMGFNNEGFEYLLDWVDCWCYQGVLGINVGKNKDILNEQLEFDYCIGICFIYIWVDYIMVNVLLLNMFGLWDLQFGDLLK